MKIGEYIICKNELQHLEAGLKELIKLDVICILDTGSTDGTYERLLELERICPNIHVRQKIYDPFYFDDARNDALDFAAQYMEEGDGLFTLDLDEYASNNFVDIVRPQCEQAIDCNALCLRDQNGCWHWQGHRFSRNYKGFYHIHETILTVDKKEIDNNLYLRDVSYFHNQDESKPRNYRRILNKMVEQEPDCLHYLVNALEEERKAQENPEYAEGLRQRIFYNVMNNKDDVHYHDYAYLAFAAADTQSNFDSVVQYFYEAENDILQGNFRDSRYFHTVFARLLKQLPNTQKKIEEEYLYALMLKTDLGWWLEGSSSIENILLDFVMGLFYDKKDFIAAEFYAQQLYILSSTEQNKNNLIACKNACGNYLLFLQNDSDEDIEKLIDNINIGVVVWSPITSYRIRFLLDKNIHLLLHRRAYGKI